MTPRLRQLGVERAKTPGGSGQDRLCLHPRPAAVVAPARGHDDVGRRRRPDGGRRRGGRAGTDPARRGFAEGGASRWVPFAAPRNPVDVTAQALNDPSILDKGFDLLFGKENFPAMVGFFTTWASSPQMAEPLFQAVSGAAARYPDRYFALSAIATPGDAAPLRGGRGRAVRGPVARGRSRSPRRCAAPSGSRRRRCRCRRCRATCRRCRRARIAEHEAKRILAEAGVPVLDERAGDQRRRGAGRAPPRSASGWC